MLGLAITIIFYIYMSMLEKLKQSFISFLHRECVRLLKFCKWLLIRIEVSVQQNYIFDSKDREWEFDTQPAMSLAFI